MVVPSPRIAAIGKMKLPISEASFKPPHLPKNNTPFGFLADSKSIIKAAFGEPIPKFMMLKPSELVVLCIAPPSPLISQLNLSAKAVT